VTIDIDKLTIGELKQIASLAAQLGLTVPTTNAPQTAHPFIGKYAICRCYAVASREGGVD
jgi:hypothetical protein